MTSPRPFTFAILPVYGLPSVGERPPQAQAARPAQPGTDFSNVYLGCAGVPDVPPHFFMGQWQRGSIVSAVVEAASIKVDQLWQLQILAILAMRYGCSASVPEQKIATGTAQPEASEGLTSICSVFRFIFRF